MKRKAAFYIRLSDADEEVRKGKKDESNSISAQRELLYAFVKKNSEFENYEIMEYFDDGISGTRFEDRTKFRRLIEDAKNGCFECILVKDFSRFGRDYLEVGNYLEFVFPLMGIRFISVNDGYDSSRNMGMTGGMDVAFKNLIYQLYSRDLSKKVKTARRNRNLNGEYTASFVVYGYRKDPSDHHRLVVDEEEAAVVREIFAKSADGMNAGEIARSLNMRNIPTKLKRQRTKSRYVPVHDHGDYLWSNNMVLSILRNEAYTGVLIQNKSEIRGFGDTKKLVKRNRKDWSVVEGGVPAIISKETFEEAQRFTRAADKRPIPLRKHNLFECPYCGRKLQRRRYKTSIHLICPVRDMVRDSLCYKVMMPLENAEESVLNAARKALSEQIDQKSVTETCGQNDQKLVKRQMEDIRSEQAAIESSAIEHYRDYRQGVLTKEAYMTIRAEGRKRSQLLEEEWQALAERLKNGNPGEETESCNRFDEMERFDADILSEIISKVLVYDDKKIEIIFKD